MSRVARKARPGQTRIGCDVVSCIVRRKGDLYTIYHVTLHKFNRIHWLPYFHF
jgi:hypothetical protein